MTILYMHHIGKISKEEGQKIGEVAAGGVTGTAVCKTAGAIKDTCFSKSAGETVEGGLAETVPADEEVLEYGTIAAEDSGV
jgi:hypothetical protein